MITRKSNVQPVEVFFFQRSIIVCHGRGTRGLNGTFDEYFFAARFPMNTLQVENPIQSLDFTLIGPGETKMSLVAKDKEEKETWMKELMTAVGKRNTFTECITRQTHSFNPAERAFTVC